MWLLQCCLLVQAVTIRAAYYHVPSMTTIRPPEPLNEDSFFGYSNAFYGRSLVASAPRADIDGQLFSCDLATTNCTRMTVPITAATSRDNTVDSVHYHYDHNFWLGATVQSTVIGVESYLLVCAPRTTSEIQIVTAAGADQYKYFGTNGRCYYKKSSESKFVSMLQMSKMDRRINITRSENATDSFGWSMDVDSKGAIRVGSPAIAAVAVETAGPWAVEAKDFVRDLGRRLRDRGGDPRSGSYLVQKISLAIQRGNAASVMGTFGPGRVITYSDLEEAVSINPKFLGAAIPKGFTFGYSIATGIFISSASSSEYEEMPGIAIGSPYGDNGVGKVFFYDNDQNLLWVVDDPAGVGSMFATALCSARIDGSTTSLLVGAPAHFSGNDKYHTGIVYVYRHDVTTKNTMGKYNSIEGNKDGAFFGYAIANVGDMDQDGKDEIVIAAPYEDEGKGVVYLYAGSSLSDGQSATWLQRFQPEGAVYQNLGLSLVANKYSDNACRDLAIGAPGNDSVAVFRCLTVITVDIQKKVPDLQNRADKTSFAFDLCLNPKYPSKPKKITAKFAVKVKITHPHAVLTDAKESNDFVEYLELLDSTSIVNPNGCRKINVTTVETGDYGQDIQFNIAAKLLDDPTDSTEFDSSKGTVSTHSELMTSFQVTVSECNHKICKPELSVKVTTNVKNPYLIGSSKTESVSVSVSNGNADTAYRPCVRVSVSGDASVHSAPAYCKFDGERQRICQRQRPLKPNENWEVSNESIELDLTGLTSKSEDILVKAEVFNRCETKNKPDDTQLIKITFITNTDGLKIESKTDQGEIIPFHKEDFKYEKILHHIYTISNLGQINWAGIYCDLWLYTADYITYIDSIKIYNGESELPPCLVKKEAHTTSNFHGLSCELGPLLRKQTITVVIPITPIPSALEKVLEQTNATVKTFLRVIANSHEAEKRELTTLVLQEGVVPIWIIVVAALVGLLIVALIAFALYECGLLRRKKKEELVELKREVKRKSMVLQRQSMRLSDSARAELRNRTYRELLDAAEIKEAEAAEEARKSQLTSSTDQGTKRQDITEEDNGSATSFK